MISSLGQLKALSWREHLSEQAVADEEDDILGDPAECFDHVDSYFAGSNALDDDEVLENESEFADVNDPVCGNVNFLCLFITANRLKSKRKNFCTIK